MYIYRRTKNFFLLFLGSNLLLDTRKHQWFLTMWPVLFYFIPLVGHLFLLGFFFTLFSFISIRVVIGIPECFLACVTPSWNFLMDYIGVYFLWFYLWGGCCLFFGVLGGLCSLSLPRLSPVPSRGGPGAVPVLHPPVWLVPVWMCSLCSRSAAQYFSGFNCSLVGRWNPAEGQAAI